MTDTSQHISGQICILKDLTLFKDNGDGTAFGVKQKRMDSTTPGLHDLLGFIAFHFIVFFTN